MASETQFPSGLDFGTVLAFVAPGFVVVHAVSYHLPVAAAWMAAASDQEQSVGLFLFVLLASVSFGLVVSGLRWIIIDTVIHWPALGRFAVQRLSLDWSRVDGGCLPVLLTIRDNFYRYYQFYANTLTALLLWIPARAFAPGPTVDWPYWVVLTLTGVALLLSARNAMSNYVKAVHQVFPPKGRTQ